MHPGPADAILGSGNTYPVDAALPFTNVGRDAPNVGLGDRVHRNPQLLKRIV